MDNIELFNLCNKFVERNLGIIKCKLANHRLILCGKISNNQNNIFLIIGALTYDVVTCKNTELLFEYNNFLNDIIDKKNKKYKKYISKFLLALNCASFGVEQNAGRNFFNELLEPDFLDLRNIISDANKALRLGRLGFELYKEYIIEKYDEELNDDKIMLLYKNDCKNKYTKFVIEDYIKTELGLELCKKLHKETLQIIN